MKTLYFSLSVVIMFLTSVLGLTSCDNDNTIFNADKSLTGKWRAVELTIFGSDEVYKPKNLFIEYQSSGKVISYQDGEKYESKYYIEDNIIYVGEGPKYSSYEYEITGNKMKVTFKGHPDAWCVTGMTKDTIYERVK